MSHEPTTDLRALQTRLDAAARRGTEHITGRRAAAAFSKELRIGLLVLLVVPAFVFFVQVVQAVHGQAPWDVNGWVVLLLTLAAPVFWLVVARLARETPAPSRGAALALFDAEGHYADRLTAADQFLRVETDARDDFMQAAIEDASSFAAQAERVELPPSKTAMPKGLEVLRLGGAALLMCLLVGLLGRPATSSLRARSDAGDGTTVATAGDPDPVDNPSTDPRDQVPPPAKDPEPEESNKGEGASKESERAPAELKEEAKKTQGRTGAGQASDAESTSGANDARGTPTEQSPSAKKTPKKVKKPVKKPLEKKTSEAEKHKPKKMTSEQSGATAGRGSSKGSNKNPVTSSWKSKDQVEPDDEDELEDDEDVEDEESDSEARGGMQPNLRDRRPPVSRDLTIGFGNQPNPDANGRGGPSEQKKSRGTASLVLGVPIPDRVKGQPNPGKSKVTQERVEPRRETSPSVNASKQTPRDARVGRVAEPSLDTWLRGVIRRYFLELRTQSPKGAR